MITALMAIVALSYYQTIYGYPSGGGSYVVARENLGVVPGLLAASALLVDYLLTAAVSLTAGVEAIASAFPALWGYRIELSLLILAVITLINLRGTKETGTLMSGPVYLFLVVYLAMLAYGAFRVLTGGVTPLATTAPPAVQPLTVFLLLRAFATGCTAMTGIEAISNGVPVFKPPEPKNAGRTLLVMALLMGVLFVGSIGITQALGVVSGPQETILSALARRLLGSGPAYLIVQAATLADPGGSCQHQLRRLPAAGCDAGGRWLPAPAAHRSGRPARVRQRHRDALARHRGADCPLPRRQPRADPALRGGRVPGLHAFPNRHGATLDKGTRPRVGTEGDHQRPRR